MFKPLKRPNCKMIAGDAAYIGMTGLIVDKADKHFRVILDKPVGDVTEGLWLPREVALIRPPKGWTPPVGFEAAMAAMPELPKPLASVEPPAESASTQPASDAPVIEETETKLETQPATDTTVLDTAIAAIGGKKKGRKVRRK